MSVNRKINVDQLTEEQLQTAIDTIGGNMRKDVDEICEKYKKLLKRYGLTCKMDVHIGEEEQT